jgi:hypothetical protein
MGPSTDVPRLNRPDNMGEPQPKTARPDDRAFRPQPARPEPDRPELGTRPTSLGGRPAGAPDWQFRSADGARAGVALLPGSADRQNLADRLANAENFAGARAELRDRLDGLMPGHPSSPWEADGTPRPPVPQLTELELPEPPMSDADYADHVREVAKLLDRATAEGLTTDRLHTLNPDHDIWTDDRADVHDQIIEDAYRAAANVPCERQAVIAGGLGGAGKTTVLEQYAGIDRSQFLTINPDGFKEELARRGLVPQIPGLSPMEASTLGHEESSYLARQLALRALADGKNIIWDVTMSSLASASRRVDELRAAEYRRVDGLFVDIPIETSVGRVEARHRQGHDLFLSGEGLGGRLVPAEVTRSQADPDFGSVNRRAFETLKDRFDHWAIYDNSADGRPPILTETSV